MTRQHKGRKALLIAAIAVGLAVGLGTWVVNAQDPDTPPCDFFGAWGGGQGMMSDRFPESCAGQGWYGMGMMGGLMRRGMRMGGVTMGGMSMRLDPDAMGRFGPGTGMMSAWTPPAELAPTEGALTLEQAVSLAEVYIAAWGDEDALEPGEVMQFSNHFYAQAREADTERGAFEFLIDPATGAVIGEPGPNMMWNLHYGMTMAQGMGMWTPADVGDEMAVSPEEARAYAQAFLDEAFPGLAAGEEADAFYGYYTLHILEDGEIVGMLSVNGYSGQVWLHHWHGDFIEMIAEAEAMGMSDAAPAGVYRTLTVDEFAAILANRGDEYTVINVHIPYEEAIDGTDAHVPYNDLDALTAALPDRDAPIVLYCRSGRMSESAARALLDRGYTQVWDVPGGMIAWEESGRPVQTGD